MFSLIEATRANHALEHATITLLIQKLGLRLPLAGRATQDGFYVYGDLPTERVREAAEEALVRLQQGEASLAVSPFCGTNIVVTGILSTLLVALAFGSRVRWERFPQAIFGATLGVLMGQPLGRWVQTHLTTSPQLQGVQIERVAQVGGIGRFLVHRVHTLRREVP